MDYVTLGSTGVHVSPLCFGTMSFGSEADEQTSGQMFGRVRDAGINFFDTADAYGAGASEEILGRLVGGQRDEIVIASKVFYPTGSHPNAGGLSRRHVLRAAEASLRRLGTDWIDVYFVHAFDSSTPVEETLQAMQALRDQGKILYLGVSNWAAWQIALALGMSARQQLARFEVVQQMYNLVRRQAEVEILPLAVDQRLGVVTYSPLGGGLLTGKYGIDSRPATGRLIEQPRYADRYDQESDFATAERFTALAAELGTTPAALGVAWVKANPAVTAPIIGARNLHQLDGVLGALDIDMDQDLYQRITELSPTPPPATDRTETHKAGWT